MLVSCFAALIVTVLERPLSAGEEMKFSQLILRRIVATKCQILRVKCTQIDFGWGFAPDPAGEHTVLPQTP